MLTSCINHPPMKFINPRPDAGSCQVYMSNYGGGLLGGDEIRIKVECLPDSRLYLGTQSSNKIYRTTGNRVSLQETTGTLHARALAVICPDPVVPFAGSRFRQKQTWELHKESNFILVDRFQSGREARGEVFAFDAFESEIRLVRPGGRPLLVERFGCEPRDRGAAWCGNFGPFRSWMGIYLAGERISALGDAFVPSLLELGRGDADGPEPEGGRRLWVAIGKKEGLGWVIRAMGRDRRDLEPVQDRLFAALSDAGWLGFNPWHRRW